MQARRSHVRIAANRFHPSLALTAATLVIVAVCLRLAYWQWQRAAEKQAIEATMQARVNAATLELTQLDQLSADLRYRRVSARGEFLSDRQILLDNRTYAGRAGYHVITPLRLKAGGEHVLVNRGWLAATLERGTLPAVAVPAGEIEVRGRLEVPGGKPGLVQLPPPERWGSRWPYLDLEHYGRLLGQPLRAFVILQAPEDVGELVRDWPIATGKRHLHIGYAVQWFAFAVIALIVYWRLSLRRER